MHRPRLLVSDEATSNLDPATEWQVDEALSRLRVTQVGQPGLLARMTANLTDVDARIADLTVRTTLLAAVRARCPGLLSWPANPCCPLPSAELASPAGDIH